MKLIRWLSLLGTTLIALFWGISASAAETGNTVNLFVDEAFEKAYETNAATVGDFLEEAGIPLHYFDLIEPSVDTELNKRVTNVKITKAYEIELLVDGQAVSAVTTKLRLADFVAKYKAFTGVSYFYDREKWAEFIEPGSRVLLSSATYTTQIVEVPFETVIVYNDQVNEGEVKILTSGNAGEKLVTVETRHVEGDTFSSRVIKEEFIKEPIVQIMEVGTAKTVDSFQYSQVFTMSATAYTSDYASTGKRPGDKYFGVTASGLKAQVGVVAVDPKVIPLGTELYIEDYGYAIAGDTGGAIKGMKIDLYFDTNQECRNFGRQTKLVYVLK